jgi:NAD(P)-dependent dehydrogenase (short-subunit alcohol dehydrogenase family)
MASPSPVVLVTGAAGGLGSAVVRRTGLAGGRIVAMDSNEDSLNKLAAEAQESGISAVTVLGNVSVEQECEAAAQMALQQYGRLDSLVAAAAIQHHLKDHPVHELEVETWEAIHAINLRGVFLSSKAALRAMLSAGNGGSLVLIGSVTALAAVNPMHSAYTASKGGVISLGRAIAAHYGQFGIRCNVLCPGILERLPSQDLGAPDVDSLSLPEMPLHRRGTFDEIAAAVDYLMSPEASYMTGSVMVVDGGLTAV